MPEEKEGEGAEDVQLSLPIRRFIKIAGILSAGSFANLAFIFFFPGIHDAMNHVHSKFFDATFFLSMIVLWPSTLLCGGSFLYEQITKKIK